MEIKDPTKTDYVYTDGSKGAENAIQSGKYSIRFDNLLPSNKTFNNIKISFDSNFKVDYPDGITSIDVTNQSENNLPDLSINKVISAGKQKTLSLIESGDTYATFEFEAYDPDLFESKNAVLTLSDGTNEIEREILNNDFKIIESPTRDLGNSTTYSFKVDGLSKLTTYTVKSFVFDDVNQEILGPIKFTTTKKPFP
jgi:hypothetical protein